ncbi:hypothetical protein [Salinispora fenicalii]|uniref:hypothetical protein n=1 Tax=Salinispora fenicalii TaxID=1137263 RepID=UPI00048484A4|nr:hypothetical protein [Salinispora fenicalii]
MADDGRREQRAYPVPDGRPPLPDGDRVRAESPPAVPPTTRQKLITALVLVIILVGVVIGSCR